MGKFRQLIENLKMPTTGWAFFLLAESMDILTSVIGSMRGFEESNPFTRAPVTHEFVLSKGIAVKLCYLAAMLIASKVAYDSFKKMDVVVARAMASIPFFYYGVQTLGVAVIPNLLLIFGYGAP